MLGLNAAVLIAHKLGHYARDACGLSPIGGYQNLTLRQILAWTIIEEGIAMTFQTAYLKRLLKLKHGSLAMRIRALWQLSGISDYLMNRSATPIETWAHQNDIREGGRQELTRYSFSGTTLYEYGQSEIKRIMKEQNIPMHRLLLSASDYINCKSVLAAAAKAEKHLVRCTQKAFKSPQLTSSNVRNMLIDL